MLDTNTMSSRKPAPSTAAVSTLDALGGLDKESSFQKWSASTRILRDNAATLSLASEKELSPLIQLASSSLSLDRSLEAMTLLAKSSSDDLFCKHAKSWLDSIAQAIKKTKRRSKCLSEALDALLTRSRSHSEVSRHASSLSQGLASALLNPSYSGCKHSLACLKAILSTYPGTCGALQNNLQKELVSQLSPGSVVSLEEAASLFCLLPRLGGSGRDGVNHIEAWAKLSASFVATLSRLLDQIQEDLLGYAVVNKSPIVGQPFNITGCKTNNLLDNFNHLSKQVHRVARCLCRLLLAGFPHQKKIQLEYTVELCLRASEVMSAKVEDQSCKQLLVLYLPDILKSFGLLARATLKVCSHDCLPFAHKLSEFCWNSLQSFSENSTYFETRQTSVTFRCVILDLLADLIDLGGHGVLEEKGDFFNVLLREIVPFQKKMSIVTRKNKNSKNDNKNEDGSHHSKTSSSPAEVATTALKCINSAVCSGGELLNVETHRLLCSALVTMGLKLSKQSSDSNDFKLNLYECLLSLVLHSNPKLPPPTSAVASIFEAALAFEKDSALTSFLRSAKMSIQTLVRPRALPLDVPTYRLDKLQDSRKDLSKVHIYVLRDEGQETSSFPISNNSRKRPAETTNQANEPPKVSRQEEKEDKTNDSTSKTEQNSNKNGSGDKELVESVARNYLKSSKAKKKKGKKGSDSDEEFSEPNLQPGEGKKLMEEYYDFSQTSIVIPEGAKVPKEAEVVEKSLDEEVSKVDEKKDGDDNSEEGFDVGKTVALFVMEESSDEDE